MKYRIWIEIRGIPGFLAKTVRNMLTVKVSVPNEKIGQYHEALALLNLVFFRKVEIFMEPS